jgi:thiosulfate/3-mercaptopyruvate sulfurtransferase
MERVARLKDLHLVSEFTLPAHSKHRSTITSAAQRAIMFSNTDSAHITVRGRMSPTRFTALTALLLSTVVSVTGAQSARPTRADLVVTPVWLADHLSDANLVLLHVGDKVAYDKAHIPGARYVEMDNVSVSSMNHVDSLMLEMPTPDSLRAQLARLGISDNSRIILYYDANRSVSWSTRIMLALDYAGFGARSALLDGGIDAWKEAGHPVTAESTKPAVVGKLSPLKINPVIASIAYVQSHLKDPNFHLIDGRAPVFYDGVQQGMDPGRKGHIPGAHNIPFNEITDEKAHLKSPEQLAALFTKAGVGPRDTVVAYCHIGQQATEVLFAARTLGHPVLLFDGSFQEWGRRTDLPVENPSDGSKKP